MAGLTSQAYYQTAYFHTVERGGHSAAVNFIRVVSNLEYICDVPALHRRVYCTLSLACLSTVEDGSGVEPPAL